MSATGLMPEEFANEVGSHEKRMAAMEAAMKQLQETNAALQASHDRLQVALAEQAKARAVLAPPKPFVPEESEEVREWRARHNPNAIIDRMVSCFNPGGMMAAGKMKSSVGEKGQNGKTVWRTTTNDDRPGYRGGLDPRDKPAELNGPAGQEAKKITKRY